MKKEKKLKSNLAPSLNSPSSMNSLNLVPCLIFFSQLNLQEYLEDMYKTISFFLIIICSGLIPQKFVHLKFQKA